MRTVILLFFCALGISSLHSQSNQRELIEVATIKGAQFTGITVTEEGRIFVNFPRWRGNIPFSVAEILKDGSFKAYPDGRWNFWMGGQNPDRKFVCVQSVVAKGDYLWVLDPANPLFRGVIEGGAKLLQFDLRADTLARAYHFPDSTAPKNSYLNDLRIDYGNQEVYITCSGLGAIVTLDIETGESRRLLQKHPSIKAEDVVLEIGGKKLIRPDGSKPQIHSDGIALGDDKLYYHALTGYSLYAADTEELLEPDEEDLPDEIEFISKTPATDGMIMDSEGNLFMGDLENNAVVYMNESGEIKTLAKGAMISWPDTFSIGPDGFLYFTCARIHETEAFDKNADISSTEFRVFKIDIKGLE